MVDAVKTEAKAIQVAAAVETVSEATRQLVNAKEDASRTLGAVEQAAEAMIVMANQTADRGDAGVKDVRWHKATEADALALGRFSHRVHLLFNHSRGSGASHAACHCTCFRPP